MCESILPYCRPYTVTPFGCTLPFRGGGPYLYCSTRSLPHLISLQLICLLARLLVHSFGRMPFCGVFCVGVHTYTTHVYACKYHSNISSTHMRIYIHIYYFPSFHLIGIVTVFFGIVANFPYAEIQCGICSRIGISCICVRAIFSFFFSSSPYIHFVRSVWRLYYT